MDKIVALNSGGFDSIIMLHRLREKYPTAEIHTMFFRYGQLTIHEEYECASKWVENDKNSYLINMDIDMPCAVDMTAEEQYIPDRNLIFLSYATSYAESIGAKEIYMAITNPEKPESERYFDTSNRFVAMYNALIEPLGIKVVTPIANLTKEQLYLDVWKYRVEREDFHSCNLSTDSHGCGECGDCKAIDWIYNTKRHVYPVLHYLEHGFDEELKQLVCDETISSAKLILNDKCQFHCKHCYMGAQDKVTGKPLTLEEWKKVIDECVNYGIKQFDLFGREVLFDDGFIPILEHIYSKGYRNTAIVTNGVNVAKYIDVLRKYKPLVVLSVESLENTSIRTGTVKDDTFRLLLENNIPVQVSIDLSKSNYKSIIPLIDHLYTMGIRDFYIKPIIPLGEYSQSIKDNMVLTANEVMDAFDAINSLDRFTTYSGIKLSTTLKMYHIEQMRKECPERFSRMMYVYNHFKTGRVANMFMNFELYCSRFEDITITPDGKVLGCATEYAVSNPISHNKGLRNQTLQQIIEIEKSFMPDFLCKHGDKKGCYFTNKKFC